MCVSVPLSGCLSLSLSLISSAAGEERAAVELWSGSRVSRRSGFFFFGSLPLSSARSSSLHSSSERNLHRLFFLLSSQQHSHGQLRLSLRAGDRGGTYTPLDDDEAAATAAAANEEREDARFPRRRRLTTMEKTLSLLSRLRRRRR